MPSSAHKCYQEVTLVENQQVEWTHCVIFDITLRYQWYVTGRLAMGFIARNFRRFKGLIDVDRVQERN
jgi:hypothetical protein